MNSTAWFTAVLSLTAAVLGPASASAAENSAPPLKQQLPRPEGQPADQSKKVKVFILMGQSNMVGMGDIEPEGTNGTLTTLVKKEKRYPFLVDDRRRATGWRDNAGCRIRDWKADRRPRR